MEKYDIPFDELFDTKKQAVICFLSLERRYLALHKTNRHLMNQLSIMTSRFGNWFLNRRK